MSVPILIQLERFCTLKEQECNLKLHPFQDGETWEVNKYVEYIRGQMRLADSGDPIAMQIIVKSVEINHCLFGKCNCFCHKDEE